MGYRSEIVIGIHHDVLTHDLISGFIPACIKEEEYSDHADDDNEYCFRFYMLEGWKFYRDNEDVEAILKWFEKMDELELKYGAMRMGEEFGDIETWGDPDHFNIYAAQSICF